MRPPSLVWTCPASGGQLWQGCWKDAMHFTDIATSNAAGPWCIINCSHLDYEWDERIQDRYWHHISYFGSNWEIRMEAALKKVIQTIAAGGNVLVHCRQGKHRASVFTAKAKALMTFVASEVVQ